MGKITKEDIVQTADLARLAVTDTEAEQYSEDLTKILNFVKKINEINTDDVEPTTHGIIGKNVLRADIPETTITREDALANAPDHEDNQFKVLPIIE